MVNSNITINPNVQCFTSSGSNIFAGIGDYSMNDGGGVYLSIDHGASWTEVDSGRPKESVFSLAASSSNIFAGTNSGIWCRPLSDFTTAINNKRQKLSPKLAGINLTTSAQSNRDVMISFSLAQAQPVSLNIFNLSGREISTLVNSSLGADEHSLLWNTKGMAAGCYAIKMQAGSNVFVKNFLVSR
jgi:hypothetical protein